MKIEDGGMKMKNLKLALMAAGLLCLSASQAKTQNLNQAMSQIKQKIMPASQNLQHSLAASATIKKATTDKTVYLALNKEDGIITKHGQSIQLTENLLYAVMGPVDSDADLSIATSLLDHGADPNAVFVRGKEDGCIPESNGMGAGDPSGDGNFNGEYMCNTLPLHASMIMLAIAQVDQYYDDYNELNKNEVEVYALKVVKLLIDHGADINAQDNNGETAIGWAMDEGDPGMIKFLANSGANLNVTSQSGETLISYASESKDSELLNFLFDHGAHEFKGTTHYGRLPNGMEIHGHLSGEVGSLTVQHGGTGWMSPYGVQ